MPPASLADTAHSRTSGEAASLDSGAPPRAANTGSARAQARGARLSRLVALLRPRPKAGGSYRDPLFGWPDLVENDYYRLRRQPFGS
jgi:hypothetical protein